MHIRSDPGFPSTRNAKQSATESKNSKDTPEKSEDENKEDTIPASLSRTRASMEIVENPVYAPDGEPSLQQDPSEQFHVKTGSPEDRANIFSRLGFFYMDPILWKARSKALAQEDMWELSEVMLCTRCCCFPHTLVDRKKREMLSICVGYSPN